MAYSLEYVFVLIVIAINVFVSDCSPSPSSVTTDSYGIQRSRMHKRNEMPNIGIFNEEMRKKAYESYLRLESSFQEVNGTRSKRRSRSHMSFKTYLIQFMFGMLDEQMEATVRWANRVDAPNVYYAKDKNYGVPMPSRAYQAGINFESAKNNFLINSLFSFLGISPESIDWGTPAPSEADINTNYGNQ